MSLRNYLWYFIIYSFFGWICEVLYAAHYHKKFVNRGFLNGPVCPIYGFGVVFVYIILSPIKDMWFTLFLGSVIVTSTLEWVTGFVMEHLFRHKWWDYSDVPFNLNGYICLTFSLIWGVVCVFIVKFVFPLTDIIIKLIPPDTSTIVISVILSAIALDTVTTVIAMIDLNKQIAQLHKLSEQLKKSSSDMIIRLYEEKKKNIGIRKKRIFNAFPDLRSINYNEQLMELRNEFKRRSLLSKKYIQSKVKVQNMSITVILEKIVHSATLNLWIALSTVAIIIVIFEIVAHVKMYL